MKVWVFSDGRPGHFNQSRGLLKALRLAYEVEDLWVDVQLRVGIARRLLRYLLNSTSRPLPETLLGMCYRLPGLPESHPDLIVSAGGKTSFVNAWMARRYRCPNVFAGSLRGLSDRHFGTVFTLEPVPGAKNNTVLEHIPTTIDPEEVQRAGQILKQQLSTADHRLWAMVIGGDGAGYRYTPEDWKRLAGGMSQLAGRYGIRWLVTSSRRTGAAAEKTLANAVPAEFLADATWYHTQPRKVVMSYMGAADLLFCTEDSMSMITEGVASGKGVVTLSPSWFRPEPRYLAAIGRLQTRGRLRRHSVLDLAALQVDDQLLASFRPVEQSSAEVLLPHLQRVLEAHPRLDADPPSPRSRRAA